MLVPSNLAGCLKKLPVPIVILDLEATGGHVLNDRIIEIALLHFDNGNITELSQLIRTSVPISPFVSKLTGIDEDMLAGSPTFSEFMPRILPLLRGSLLIAHNGKFDYTLLQSEFRRESVEFAAPVACSVKLSRKFYPQYLRHGLDSIAERLGVPNDGRHRAMADVALLVQYLESMVNERGQEAFLNALLPLVEPSLLPENLPSVLKEQIYGLPDGHGVSVWYDDNRQVGSVRVHRHAFTEIAGLLGRQPRLWRKRMHFIAASDGEHSEALRIQLIQAGNEAA